MENISNSMVDLFVRKMLCVGYGLCDGIMEVIVGSNGNCFVSILVFLEWAAIQ